MSARTFKSAAAAAGAVALAVSFSTALATGASAAAGSESGSDSHVTWTQTVSDTNPHVGDTITVTTTIGGTEEGYTLTEADVKSVLPSFLDGKAGWALNKLQENNLDSYSGSVPKYITAMNSGLDGCFAYQDGSAAITQDSSDLTGWDVDADGAITGSGTDLQISKLSGATPITWTADYKVTCDPGTYTPSASGTIDYTIKVPINVDNPIYECVNIPWVGEKCGPGEEHYDPTFSKTITDTTFATGSGPAIDVRGAISTSLSAAPAPQGGVESTLTATVANADAGGTVTFTNNGSTIGTAALEQNGTASITWTPDASAAGDAYSLVATYKGAASSPVTGTIAAAENTGGGNDNDGGTGDGNTGDTGGDQGNGGGTGLLGSLQSLQAIFG